MLSPTRGSAERARSARLSVLLLQDCITFRIYPKVTKPSVGEIRRILTHDGLAHIGRIVPDQPNSDLTTLVVMFPSMDVAHADRLQTAWNGCLEYLNGRGLMLSPFFQGSKQPAQYNPDFHPFQAPFPICAFRPMTLRDIVFIMNQDGFREYHRRFGAKYEAGAFAASTGLPQLYQRAAEKFA